MRDKLNKLNTKIDQLREANQRLWDRRDGFEKDAMQIRLAILAEEKILDEVIWSVRRSGQWINLSTKRHTWELPEFVELFGFNPNSIHNGHEHIDLIANDVTLNFDDGDISISCTTEASAKSLIQDLGLHVQSDLSTRRANLEQELQELKDFEAWVEQLKI